MKNDLFSIGPFTIHGYGLMMAIGILTAYYMVEYRAKKKGMEYEKIFSLAIWAVVGGLLGAKILYLLTRLPDIAADPSLILHSLKDGFVVYGSIIGGVAAAAISLENILSDAVPDGGVCRLDLGTPLGDLPKRSGEACDPGTAGEAEDILGRVLFPAGPPFGPPYCGSGEWGERA